MPSTSSLFSKRKGEAERRPFLLSKRKHAARFGRRRRRRGRVKAHQDRILSDHRNVLPGNADILLFGEQAAALSLAEDQNGAQPSVFEVDLHIRHIADPAAALCADHLFVAQLRHVAALHSIPPSDLLGGSVFRPSKRAGAAVPGAENAACCKTRDTLF